MGIFYLFLALPWHFLVVFLNRPVSDGWNRWSYTIGHFLFIFSPSMTFSRCFSQTKKNYSRPRLVTWTSLIIVWILNNILSFGLISVINYNEINVPFLNTFMSYFLFNRADYQSPRILNYITCLLIFILDRYTNKK